MAMRQRYTGGSGGGGADDGAPAPLGFGVSVTCLAPWPSKLAGARPTLTQTLAVVLLFLTVLHNAIAMSFLQAAACDNSCDAAAVSAPAAGTRRLLQAGLGTSKLSGAHPAARCRRPSSARPSPAVDMRPSPAVDSSAARAAASTDRPAGRCCRLPPPLPLSAVALPRPPAGVRGFSATVLPCGSIYRYYWAIDGLTAIGLAFAVITIAGLVHRRRTAVTAFFVICLYLNIEASDAFFAHLYTRTFSEGGAFIRARSKFVGCLAQAAVCLLMIVAFGIIPGAGSDRPGAGSKAADGASPGSSPVGRGRTRSPGPTVRLTVVDGEAYEEYEERY